MPAKQLVCWGEAVVVVVVVVVLVGCFSSIDHYSMGLSPDRLALSRNTFPSLPPLGGVTTQLLRRKTDKQRPSEDWRGQVRGGGAGPGQGPHCRLCSPAADIVRSCWHYRLPVREGEREREREREKLWCQILFLSSRQITLKCPPQAPNINF